MDGGLRATIQAANDALLAGGDTGAIEEFFAPDYVAHLTGRDVRGGHGVIQEVVETYRRCFPDLRVDVEILVEGGDRIAWQRTLRGTHGENFKGFPATGREVVWRDMVTSRFRDGLIVEDWVITDLAERLLLSRKGG